MTSSVDKDEMLHKMNKKIAQLTKVIFHLNTRNDENDLLQKAMVDAYEVEVEGVVKEANQKLQKSITMIDKLKVESGSRQVEKLKKQYDDAKERAHEDLKKLKLEVEARQERSTKQWVDKIKSLEEECKIFKDSIKNNEKILKEFEQLSNEKLDRALEDAEEKHVENVERLKADFKKERENFEAMQGDANSKTNLMMAEIQASHEEQLAKERKRYSDCQHEFEGVKADLHEMHKSELQKLQEKCDNEMNARMNSESASSSENGQLRAQLEQVSKDAENRIAEILENLNSTSKKFEAEKADLNAELAKMQQERVGFNDTIRQLERDNLNKENDSLLARQRMEREWRAKCEGLEGELESAKKQFEETSSELEGFKNRADQLSSNLDEVSRSKQEENMAKAALQAELDKANIDLSEMSILRETEVSRLQGELNELQSKHSAAVQDAEERFQADAARVNATEEQMREMQRQHATEHSAMLASHRDAVSAVEQNFADEKAALNQKVKYLEQEVAAREGALARELEMNANNSRAQIDMVTRQCEELQIELDKEKYISAEKDDTISRLETQIVVLRQEGQDAARDAAKQLRESEQKHAEMMHQANLESERCQAKQQSDFDYRLANFESRFAQEREDFIRAAETTRETVYVLETKVTTLKSELNQSKSTAEGSMKGLRQEMQQKLTSQDGQYSVKLEKMQREHLAAMEGQRAKSQADIEALQDRLKASHQQYINEIREKYERERDAMKKQHDLEVSGLKNEQSYALKNMEVAYNQQITELDQALSEEKSARAKELAELQSQVDSLSTRLNETNDDLNTTKGQLAESRLSCDKLQVTLSETISKFEEQVAQLTTQHELAMQQAMTKHQNDVADQLSQHNQEMENQKKQFENALNHEKAVLAELQAKYDELALAYENRPSREEDVAKIQELDAELVEREENYRKLWDEMNFYKLELHNREMNYNKMFGAQPNIGTVDPTITNQKQPVKQVQRRGSSNSMMGGR